METRMADAERVLQKTVYAQFELQIKMDAFDARMQELREESVAERKAWEERQQTEQRQREAAHKKWLEQRKAERKEWEEKQAAEQRQREAAHKKWLEQQETAHKAWQEKSEAEQKKWQEEREARRKKFEEEIRIQREEFRQEMREMNRKWGELANKMGTIVEDIVAPNIPRILREYFDIDEPLFLAQRVRRRHPEDRSKRREFDVIAVSDDTVFVNETKSTLRPGDIERFAGNYREVLEFFPEYRDYEVVPIMAALSISAEELSSLTARGVYAMAMGDETMDLLNAEELLQRRAEQG